MTATLTLTKDTIESTPHNNIIAYMDDRNYIKDPRSPASVVKERPFVYETDPLHKGINFGDFPYIIVHLPTIEYSNPSVNAKNKTITWTQRIIVRTLKEGSANVRADTGRDDLMEIGDDLHGMFNNETVKTALRQRRLHITGFNKVSTDSLYIAQKLVYESEYRLEYTERFTVSS